MPSEKAPAPEKPVVMAQVGRQLTQCPSSAFGQWRFSTGLPFSTNRMCFLLPQRSSSTAVKMPAGPAPTMIRSYLFIAIFVPLLLFLSGTDRSPGHYPSRWVSTSALSSTVSSSTAFASASAGVTLGATTPSPFRSWPVTASSTDCASGCIFIKRRTAKAV